MEIVAANNHEDPGVQTTANDFFQLPNASIAASLGSNVGAVDDARKYLPEKSPARGDDECIKRCYNQ